MNNSNSNNMNSTFVSRDELESASILQQFSNGFVNSNLNLTSTNNNNNSNSNINHQQSSDPLNPPILSTSYSFTSSITPNSTSSPNSHIQNNGYDEHQSYNDNYEGDMLPIREFNLRSKCRNSSESKNKQDIFQKKRYKDFESGDGDDDVDDMSDFEDDDDDDCGGGSGRRGSRRKRIRHAVFPLWTVEEDEILLEKNLELGNDWAKIATFLPGRSRVDVKVRYKSIASASKKLWNAKDDEKIFTLYRQHNADWKTIATYFEGRTKNAVRVRYKELKRLAFQPIKAPPAGSARQIFYKRHHSHFHRNSTRADPLGLRAEAKKEELLRRHENKCEKCSNCSCCGTKEDGKEGTCTSDHCQSNTNTSTSVPTATSAPNATTAETIEKVIERKEEAAATSPASISSEQNDTQHQQQPHQLPHQHQTSSSPSQDSLSCSPLTSILDTSRALGSLQNSPNLPILPNIFPGFNWNTPPNVMRFTSPHMFPQGQVGSKYPFVCPMFPPLQQFPLMNPKGI